MTDSPSSQHSVLRVVGLLTWQLAFFREPLLTFCRLKPRTRAVLLLSHSVKTCHWPAQIQWEGSTRAHGTEVFRVMLSIASPRAQTRSSGPIACVCTHSRSGSHSGSCFLICISPIDFASVSSQQCHPDPHSSPRHATSQLHLERQQSTVFNALGSGARYLDSTRQLCGLGQFF